MTTALVREEKVHSATPDFNRIARIYRWMEWLTFGPFLQRCRCSFLSRLHSRSRGLILGDGDGRFTARLVQLNPAIRVDAVDASGAMLHELAERAKSARVQTHRADIRNFQPPQSSYDLIATHFFLDCLNSQEVNDLASRLRGHADSETLWAISEFAVPANLLGRLIARPLISGLYRAFALLTDLRPRQLPDHRQALRDSGWNLSDCRPYLGGLLVSELWNLDPTHRTP